MIGRRESLDEVLNTGYFHDEGPEQFEYDLRLVK